MACSEDEKERRFAYQTIVAIRKSSRNPHIGDSSAQRSRPNPKLNFAANTLQELITWTGRKLYEPPLTCSIPTDELVQILDAPMVVPAFPCHTQSVERGIRLINEVSTKVSFVFQIILTFQCSFVSTLLNCYCFLPRHVLFHTLPN